MFSTSDIDAFCSTSDNPYMEYGKDYPCDKIYKYLSDSKHFSKNQIVVQMKVLINNNKNAFQWDACRPLVDRLPGVGVSDQGVSDQGGLPRGCLPLV